MTLLPLPDDGAWITVYLRNGRCITGAVDQGHAWASDEGSFVLCLAHDGRGGFPVHASEGEAFWQYIDRREIVAYDWNCSSYETPCERKS